MYVAFLLLWHSKCIWDDCGLLICSFRWPESCLMMASPWGGLCKPLFWHPNLPKHSTYTTTSSAIKMKSLGTQRVLILSVRFSFFFFLFEKLWSNILPEFSSRICSVLFKRNHFSIDDSFACICAESSVLELRNSEISVMYLSFYDNLKFNAVSHKSITGLKVCFLRKCVKV